MPVVWFVEQGSGGWLPPGSTESFPTLDKLVSQIEDLCLLELSFIPGATLSQCLEQPEQIVCVSQTGGVVGCCQ